MRGRFFSGLAAGTILGTIAGMMMMPQMNYRNRRRISRASRRVEDLLNELRQNMR
ncbi:hypothetical protein ABG79_01052 [Caloramator mitchellensis]|uniref:YtxH-like protein n=1 Tax=Caloramator mitchellensis TaxID=908809 RepID=A0A0R3JUQ7_CALMK|nr:YtxH domain-containing protein [Caloramator mitchellensis]KRQ87249.1 hypothetical protein ABG79_01052 [Caloramator mitchellensis]